ncbi:MAG: DUF3450 family protein [Fibrobacterota bacterium]
MKYAVLLVCILRLSHAQNEGENLQAAQLESEISRYEEKITVLTEKTTETRRKTEEAQERFSTFESRHDSIMSHGYDRHDSLKTALQSMENQKDSLKALTAQVGREISALSYGKRRFFEELSRSVSRSVDDFSSLPDVAVESHIRDLTALNQDISDRSVSLENALERYWNTLGSISQKRFEIENWSGRSRYEGIDGTAFYLRIGYVYVACVNEAGTAGAYWDYTKNDWNAIEDPALVANIKSAIEMREGREIPNIIPLQIPYFTPTAANEDAHED